MHRRIPIAETLDQLKGCIPALWDGPLSVLVVGANPRYCKYLADLQKVGHRLTVLEIWTAYVDALQAQGYNAIQGDLLALPQLPYFDVAFWWEGPEHISPDNLGLALANLEQLADLVVLGLPWGEYEQGEVDGNPHQAHRGAYYAEDFTSRGYNVRTAGVPDVMKCGRLIVWKGRDDDLKTAP